MKALSVELINTIVGSPDGAQIAGMRRPLEGDDVRYIHACRTRGWGWQTIATLLRRNVLDVRVAAGDLVRDPGPDNDDAPPAGRAPQPERPLRPGTQMAKGFLAIANGVRTRDELARALDICIESAQRVITAIGDRGLITASQTLTPMGHAEARRLGAQADG